MLECDFHQILIITIDLVANIYLVEISYMDLYQDKGVFLRVFIHN